MKKKKNRIMCLNNLLITIYLVRASTPHYSRYFFTRGFGDNLTSDAAMTAPGYFIFFFQAEDGIRDIGVDWSSDVCSSDLVVIEHLADLDVLLAVSDEGVTSIEPSTLDATRMGRPMDALTPLWSVSSLPAGTPVAGADVSARWRRDGAVLTAALQIGAAAWTTELAVEYAKERKQF